MSTPLTTAIVAAVIDRADATLDATVSIDPALLPTLAATLGVASAERIALTPIPHTFRAYTSREAAATWALRHNPLRPTDARRTSAAAMAVRLTAHTRPLSRTTPSDDAVDAVAIVCGPADRPALAAIVPMDTRLADMGPVLF